MNFSLCWLATSTLTHKPLASSNQSSGGNNGKYTNNILLYIILHYTTTPHSARTRACFWREATPFSPRSHIHRKSISSSSSSSSITCIYLISYIFILPSSRVGYFFSIPPLWCFMKFVCLQCKVHASSQCSNGPIICCHLITQVESHIDRHFSRSHRFHP